MKSKIKGDTIQIYFTIDSDITNWKIRAEVYDKSGNSIKLATSNSGGSDTQIKKHTIASQSSTFIVYVPSSTTTDFDEDSFIEVEVDTGETIGGVAEIETVYQGNLKFLIQQITWTTP